MALLAVQEGSSRHSAAVGLDALAPVDGYRVDVQALRGLAVLLVVLYHAQVAVPGGYVGVDVFFVISGFVIGRGLLARMSGAGISGAGTSLRGFYERRARRLLPALAVLLVVVVATAPWLAPIGGAAAGVDTGIAASLFGANLFIERAVADGYFTAAAEWNPLLHTWSLSLEEQFYFVIPAVLIAAWRWGRARSRPVLALRAAIASILVGSFVIAALEWVGASDPGDLRWSFFSPVTRAWEFAAGLALVVLPASWQLRKRGARQTMVLAGVGAILLAAVHYDAQTIFPGVAALLPVAGAAAVIHGGTGSAPTGPQMSALGPFVRLGDLSYSWYLWHWPLIVYAGAFWPTAGRAPLVAAAVLSLVPAVLSARHLERRFLQRSSSDPRRTLALVAACIGVPILVAIGIRAVVEPASGSAAAEGLHALHRNDCIELTGDGRSAPDGCTWGAPGAPSVVLIGDSNADQLSDALIAASTELDLQLRGATLAGCPVADVVVDAPWFGDDGAACRTFVQRALSAISADVPAAVVVSNGTDTYLHDDEVALVDPASGRRATTRQQKADVLAMGFERTLAQLRATGTRVAVVSSLPTPSTAGLDTDPQACSLAAVHLASDPCSPPTFSSERPRVTEAQRLENGAAARAGVAVWTLDPALCPDRRCRARRDGIGLWADPGHITPDAAVSLLAEPTRRLLDGLLDGSASPG